MTVFQRTGESSEHSILCERIRRSNRCAAELLLTLGASPHTKGFQMLQNGVMLLEKQPQTQRMVFRDTLYPLVERLAERGASAEHAIRDTIRQSRSGEPLAQGTDLPTFAHARTNAEVLYALRAKLRNTLLESK